MPSGVFTLKQVEQAIGQGAWTNQPPISVNYLVVAGGGGGGKSTSGGAGAANGGGGGGGGLLQGTFGITAGTSYTVTVGSGGAGGGGSDGIGADGSNSVFGPISSTGGGGGGNSSSAGGNVGRSGGSGGGAGGGNVAALGGSGISGQGNRGGASTYAASAYGTGGGGGAGTIGLDGTSSVGGNGGAGVASDISGTRTAYSGGGGGSGYNGNGTAGTGGAGGGGSGSINGSTPGGAGSGNTGGGGGGGSFTVSGTVISNGGNGGSGIVIVSYPGTTQWFTGGVVNYYNGNVIHIFYQSGTLAPTTPTPILPTYQISRSLRFNSADSAYLNRTPGASGNRRTFTISMWVKRSGIGGADPYYLIQAGSGTTESTWFGFSFDVDVLSGGTWTSSGGSTTAVYRDPSAWYHVVLAVDTTQATAANRFKIYVNGVQQAQSTPTITQNADLAWNNSGVVHYLGARIDSGPRHYMNGYIAEVHSIDGQALDATSFGQTNAQTGVWEPKAYSGSYGTNGFYLNFSDNSNTTAATLGKDYSGNGNNWTPNNFSVAAGAGNDSLVDSPTAYGTADTGVGGEVRGNYATLNPLFNATTLSNGNLDASLTSASITGTFGPSSGKWYFECTANTVSATEYLGIADQTLVKSDGSFSYSQVYVYLSTGFKGGNGSSASYGASWTSGDVIGVAYDLDVGSITFYKNGVSQGAAFTSGFTAGNFWRPFLYGGTGTNTFTFNFGQRAFAYTAPAGYRALTTWNLPTPPVGSTTDTQAGKFFNPVLYTGNGSTLSVTGVGFQPDLVWLKQRNQTRNHNLYDAVRGVLKVLQANVTDAEVNYSNSLTSFDSDGFSLGNASDPNTNTGTYVAWNWKANGSGSTNTAGSITSTVSANTTSGFSIVTYTGNGTNGTVGHGLGAAPSMVIVKNRGTTGSWPVWHKGLTSGYYIYLNSTGAQTNTSADEFFGNATVTVDPSSTVVSLGGANDVNNTSNTYVMYCFAEVPGYSRFGSYVGNGSADGPFVYCGFRPRYIMIKSASSADGWMIQDTARFPYNTMPDILTANNSASESAYGTGYNDDALSNGFKVRSTSTAHNGNGNTYIFMAFAESPFKYSLAR